MGTSRSYYPLNVQVVCLRCSGSSDPMYVVKALLDGASRLGTLKVEDYAKLMEDMEGPAEEVMTVNRAAWT